MAYDPVMRDLEEYLSQEDEPEEEVDPDLESLAATHEGRGLYRYPAGAIEAYISDLVAELAFPMTAGLLQKRMAELCDWMEMLREIEAEKAAA